MIKQREFEGASEQEALAAAAAALGLDAADVDYTLVDEGAEGVFGIGARPARIRATVPASSEAEGVLEGEDGRSSSGLLEEDEGGGAQWVGPAPEKAAKALEVARELLSLMGVAADVSVRDEERQIVVVVRDLEKSQDVSEVFSHSRPPLGPSFQFLLNKVVNRFPEDRKHVVVDAPERRHERRRERELLGGEAKRAEAEELDPELVALAKLLGERALATEKIITVHPMRAADRRAVHQTIMGMARVSTVSLGEGLYRRMHIVPGEGLEEEEARRRKRGRRRSSPNRGTGRDG